MSVSSQPLADGTGLGKQETALSSRFDLPKIWNVT